MVDFQIIHDSFKIYHSCSQSIHFPGVNRNTHTYQTYVKLFLKHNLQVENCEKYIKYSVLETVCKTFEKLQQVNKCLRLSSKINKKCFQSMH